MTPRAASNRSDPLGLVDRSKVVRFFKSLAADRDCDLPEGLLELLPPFTLNALIFEKAIPNSSSEVVHVLGNEDSDVVRCGRLWLSAQGFGGGLQEELPLDGHEPLRARGIFQWITSALSELEELDPDSWSYIQQWLTVVVWVQRREGHYGVTELTSTSIPSAPFSTFLSKKAIRHLPPKHILPEVTLYGIQENLLHEALHQQMTGHLIVHDTLLERPEDAPKIPIPWRQTVWPLDRVLHAAWVYRGVLALRLKKLEQPGEAGDLFIEALQRSVEDGQTAFEHLAGQLEAHHTHFRDNAYGALGVLRESLA